MIFQALHESAQKGELLLIEGGICRWHLRKDGQITIREILSTQRGAGSQLLRMLKKIARKKRANTILARCPSDLPSNEWYRKKGFSLREQETIRTGKRVNIWVLSLSN